MLTLLQESPLLLLFVVAAIGNVLGRIKLLGTSLGVAAVLFVGIAFGALDPHLSLPEFVYTFGLVLFVYTIGISSGPGFFGSFRRRGLRDNGFALAMIVLGAVLTTVADSVLSLRPPLAAGMFAGALTNTPALASVVEHLKGALGAHATAAALSEPVVAYSVCYPGGVLGVLAALSLGERFLSADRPGAVAMRPSMAPAGGALVNATVRVTSARAEEVPLATLVAERGVRVVFGRRKRGEHVTVVDEQQPVAVGDLVTIVGTREAVAAAIALLGDASQERIDLDHSVLDFRRVFVSNPRATAEPLSGLQLQRRFGAHITRVRRGDVELLPADETELELGDRVRVLAPRERMTEVSAFFGDSYKALAEIDVVTFSVGIGVGLLLGSVPIPLPGGGAFKLGFAGGPLVVGLLAGRLGRTGPLVWTLPFSANLTLRQLGLVVFLAGVGTRSGNAFLSTLRHGGGLSILVAGALITFTVACASVLVGRRVLGIPMAQLSGMVAGIHTQPAALAFANERGHGDAPNLGYASVFPLATIAKILIAQLLVAFLR